MSIIFLKCGVMHAIFSVLGKCNHFIMVSLIRLERGFQIISDAVFNNLGGTLLKPTCMDVFALKL